MQTIDQRKELENTLNYLKSSWIRIGVACMVGICGLTIAMVIIGGLFGIDVLSLLGNWLERYWPGYSHLMIFFSGWVASGLSGVAYYILVLRPRRRRAKEVIRRLIATNLRLASEIDPILARAYQKLLQVTPIA